MESYNSILDYAEVGENLIVYNREDKVVRAYNKSGVMIRRKSNILTTEGFSDCIEYFKMTLVLHKYELN